MWITSWTVVRTTSGLSKTLYYEKATRAGHGCVPACFFYGVSQESFWGFLDIEI